MSDIVIANGNIAIKLHAATSWSSFMGFVRNEAVREFILFIVDDEGVLDAGVMSATVLELIVAGVVEIWLSGPKSAEYEIMLDESIIAAEAADAVNYRGVTISTAILKDDEKIAVHALKDDILEELGELHTAVIGVFSRTYSAAQTRVAELADVINKEKREYDDDM
jgi:hypothetical protein